MPKRAHAATTAAATAVKRYRRGNGMTLAVGGAGACSSAGESSGGGIRAGKQGPLFERGNPYLDEKFPRLDRIIRAAVLE